MSFSRLSISFHIIFAISIFETVSGYHCHIGGRSSRSRVPPESLFRIEKWMSVPWRWARAVRSFQSEYFFFQIMRLSGSGRVALRMVVTDGK